MREDISKILNDLDQIKEGQEPSSLEELGLSYNVKGKIVSIPARISQVRFLEHQQGTVLAYLEGIERKSLHLPMVIDLDVIGKEFGYLSCNDEINNLYVLDIFEDDKVSRRYCLNID
jgi:hypothetical protein